jgi:RNase P subunit RPR2
MINKHKNIDTKLYIKELNKIKKYKCNNCNKILSSFKNYNMHIENKTCNKDKRPICKNCGKEFYEHRNLKRHIELEICIKKNRKNENLNIVNSNNITNIGTNIQTQNNQQNNVVINLNSTDDLKKVSDILPFRDASYKIPTKKYLEYANNPRRVNLYFLQKYKCPDQAIKQFVKDYHLNPNKPERQNILNTNRRDNRVQLFDFDEDFICRWQTKDKSKVLELLCDRGVNALFFAKTMLSAAGVKLDPKKETELNAKIKEYESSDKVKKNM